MSGKLSLANRCTTSNAVHQASKLAEGERKAFLDWLFGLKYCRLGLLASGLPGGNAGGRGSLRPRAPAM